MAGLKTINPQSALNPDTGFGNTGVINGERFINRNGTFNLRKKGWPFWNRFSLYHTMINLPLWQFIFFIFIFYVFLNLVFAGIYQLQGYHQFAGLEANSDWGRFWELFFFSTQTFTTVGYGRVNPIGTSANFIASIEAMSGFLSFALATGLIYGRFAKPRANLAFSNHAVIGPYQDKSALMFRFACYKEGHALADVNIQVNLAMMIQEDGLATYKYYSLPLERDRVEQLPMNWTVVHPIDDKSPLLGFSAGDLKTADVELYVMVTGFDDVYSNTVLQRTSYTYKEIQMNRKFIPMYQETAKGTVLELHKLSVSAEQV